MIESRMSVFIPSTILIEIICTFKQGVNSPSILHLIHRELLDTLDWIKAYFWIRFYTYFELFDQRFNGTFAKTFALASLPVAH